MLEKDCEVKMKIESLQNTKVKEWNKLKEKKYRDQQNEFLIEGDHLLKEALKKGVVKEIIAVDPIFKEDILPFYEVTESIMKKLTSQKSPPKVIAVCEKISPNLINGQVCLLDNIQDPGNLGTIIRSAFAFSINTIIISEDTVDLYNEKVIRSSEGMIFHVNIIRGNIKYWINNLKQLGYTTYGTDVTNGINLKKIAFKEKSAIIIGSEGNGMKKEHQKLCDEIIYIPMENNCESLNAAIATSIIFYEMR